MIAGERNTSRPSRTKEAMDAIGSLWGAILAGAPLPEAWVQVRVVALPKEEGGYRGFGIASLLWRTGMTIIMRQLAEWGDEWAPPQLVGGLRERCADELHDRMYTDIQRVQNNK